MSFDFKDYNKELSSVAQTEDDFKISGNKFMKNLRDSPWKDTQNTFQSKNFNRERAVANAAAQIGSPLQVVNALQKSKSPDDFQKD